MYILPTLTAGRRLRLILKLLPQFLRAELLQKLWLAFLLSSINCNAMSVTLFVLSLPGLIDSTNVEMERALLKKILAIPYWPMAANNDDLRKEKRLL